MTQIIIHIDFVCFLCFTKDIRIINQYYMTDIESQLTSIEQDLKKYAEELGLLNLSNNQFQESNEHLSEEIIALTNKINKKKHQIEQENKDKQIIHQKLVKAERIKEEIQIKHTQQKTQKEREKKLREQHERQKEHEEKMKQQERVKEAEKIKLELMEKHSPKKVEEKPQQIKSPAQKLKHQQPVKQQKPTPSAEIKQIYPNSQVKPEIIKKVEAPQVPSSFYDNSQKGQYQPPALFLDSNSEDQEDDEDNSKTLQILRSKLKMEKELHDNEDDD